MSDESVVLSFQARLDIIGLYTERKLKTILSSTKGRVSLSVTPASHRGPLQPCLVCIRRRCCLDGA